MTGPVPHAPVSTWTHHPPNKYLHASTTLLVRDTSHTLLAYVEKILAELLVAKEFGLLNLALQAFPQVLVVGQGTLVLVLYGGRKEASMRAHMNSQLNRSNTTLRLEIEN